MKITNQQPVENQGGNRTIQNIQKTAGTETAVKTASAVKTAPAEKVDISSRSRDIADLMSQVNQLPDVRAQKTREIKQAVDSGTYTIDPRRIAEKLLKEL